MIRNRSVWQLFGLSILYYLASCSPTIIETEMPWQLPVRDEALLQTISRPILLSKVDTPLHW